MKCDEDGRFINNYVSIEDSHPPEELLSQISGACGRWQILIGLIGFLCGIIHGINTELALSLTPQLTNFSCVGGSSENSCLNKNGTKCKKFIYFSHQPMVTYTEKFSLVCDMERHTYVVDSSFRIGLSVSYLLIGVAADKHGKKIAAMIFIPLHCLTGAMVSISASFKMLIVARFIHGLFSSALNLLPRVALCDNVGNKWRTFALGFILYPLPVSWIFRQSLHYVFHHINGLVAAVSLAPLPLLILLLYFKESPLQKLVTMNYDKAEEAFRKIAHFNKCPLSGDIKVRPVMVLINSDESKVSELSLFLDTKKTRNSFLAVTFLWFLNGACYGFHYSFQEREELIGMAILSSSCLVASFLSITLCYWIQHRKLLFVLSLFKNVTFVAYLVYLRYFLRPKVDLLSMTLRTVHFILLWSCTVVIDNMSPRMLPTCLRSRGVGFQLSMFHIGRIIFNCIGTYVQKSTSFWVVLLLYLVAAPIFESIICYRCIWKVHNRELPDFTQDCIQFQKYFKPQRHIGVFQHKSSLNEIEIQSVNMDGEDYN